MLRLLVTLLQLFRCLYPSGVVARRVFWTCLAVIAGFSAYQVYLWLYGCRGSLTDDQTAAVQVAVSNAVDDFAASGGALPARAVVVHFLNDGTDRVTQAVRRELSSRDDWTLVSSSPVRAFVGSISSSISSASSVDEVLRPGNRVGIDVIFYGSVADISTTNGISRAEISISAYDTRRGRRIVSGVREAEYPVVGTETGRKVAKVSRARRVAAGIVIALLLPWLCAPIVFKVREAKSNAASAALMSGLLACDAFCGHFLFFGLSERPFGVVSALLLCFTYNLIVCEALARRAVR